MQREVKRQKPTVCPLQQSCNLPNELCDIVWDYAKLRTRPVASANMSLTRTRRDDRDRCRGSYVPQERPTQRTESFTEVTWFGEKEAFAFEYDHHYPCGHYQACDDHDLTYCACSRMYRLHATLLPDLAEDQLVWFVLHEDVSECGTSSAKWEVNRCFLFDSSGLWQRMTPWYRGYLAFRKPTLTETGAIRLEQDAVGIATERSTGRFLYWLVLLPLCQHEPEPNRHVFVDHDHCPERLPPSVSSCWLDKELVEWNSENEPSDEPARLNFKWIELEGPLDDDDLALDKGDKDT